MQTNGTKLNTHWNKTIVAQMDAQNISSKHNVIPKAQTELLREKVSWLSIGMEGGDDTNKNINKLTSSPNWPQNTRKNHLGFPSLL